MPALAAALERTLGKGAVGYPPADDPSGITNRLAGLYAADMGRGLADVARGSDEGPSGMMRAARNPEGAAFVVASVAEVLARAVAIPCMAILDREAMASPPLHLGELPNPTACILLDGMAHNGLL